MKINSPWPHHSLTRCTCKTPRGEVQGIQSARWAVEVDDDAEEVLLEPVKITGRGGALKVLGQGKIWSKEWGLLDVEDHVKKMELKKAEADLKKRLDDDRLRRKEEQKQEKKTQKAMRTAKVIGEKADAKLNLNDTTED